MELGIMRPSGAAEMLAKAAEKLGVGVPALGDENKIKRVVEAIEALGDGVLGSPIYDTNFRAIAIAAIAAMDTPA